MKVMINLKTRILFCVVLLSLIPITSFAQTDTITKIYSEVLQEDRSIRIHLPQTHLTQSTQSTQLLNDNKYPVLYLTDADQERWWNQKVREINKLVSEGLMPEVIIVGIINTVRNRDMIPAAVSHRPGSGGAKKFLTFIKDELITHIDKSYGKSRSNILYGASNAGLFAVYALLEEPDLFEDVIASSPMIGHCGDFMIDLADKTLAANSLESRSLFIIYGTGDSPRVLDYVPQYYDLLKRKTGSKFSSDHIVLRGEGHVPASSLTDGLKFIYKKK